MQPGGTSSVLAMSWGKGDSQRDVIALVFLDEIGRLREQAKIDNLLDAELQDEFIDILKRRKPDVIVIGGVSIATTKLSRLVKELVMGKRPHPLSDGSWTSESALINGQVFDIPVIYVPDEVARIYQHSKKATFPTRARGYINIAKEPVMNSVLCRRLQSTA